MALGPQGTVTPDSQPTLREGVQSADGHFLLDSRVPAEHPLRVAKGDLSMVHIPEMPARASFEGQPGALLPKGWDGGGAVNVPAAQFTIGVKPSVKADESDVPKSVRFERGLPVVPRLEKRRK